MSILRRQMKQTATYWPFASFDEFGDPSFGTRQILSPGSGVRWEDRTEKFLNMRGEEDQSRAVIYSAVTNFTVGSYLYLGNVSAGNPEAVGAWQIRHIEKSPDVKGRTFIRKAIV